MLKLVELNDSQFNTLVLKSSLPVLVECSSPECIICKAMEERVLEAGKDHVSRMIFFRLNVNENKRWQDFQVKVIPTLLYFKNGVLVSRQDAFPEVDEIAAQINQTIKCAGSDYNAGSEIKRAIDSEFIATRFYKYAYNNSKNGRAKEEFRFMREQSAGHKELLQSKLKELTGEVYSPTLSAADEQNLKPQGFSLFGAMKMAIKLEEKLVSIYKKLRKNKSIGNKEMFDKLIKEEMGHLKSLQKEMKYASGNELVSSIGLSDYPTWLNKVFE